MLLSASHSVRRRDDRRIAPVTTTARRRPNALGILGELLITAGVLVLLFLGWQLWWNEIVSAREQSTVADDLNQGWDDALPVPDPSDDPSEPPEPVTPPVIATPAAGQAFATIRIPRFGSDFNRPVHSGIDFDMLAEGVGYYPDTGLPGQPGNFAVAGHRTTYGKPFGQIAELQVGDAVVVETEEGWFTYRFRNLEYVWPTGTGVIAPVPQQLQVVATDSILTMTSCNPRFSAAERIIAYSVFDRFYARSDGPPEEIAATVSGAV